jgi:periplasmic protein TonB
MLAQRRPVSQQAPRWTIEGAALLITAAIFAFAVPRSITVRHPPPPPAPEMTLTIEDAPPPPVVQPPPPPPPVVQPPPEPPPPPKVVPRIPQMPVIKPPPVVKQLPKPQEPPPPVVEAPPPPPPPPPAASPAASIEAEFIAKLRAYITSITRYPNSNDARLMKPSGSVIVDFTLSRGGAISNVAVEHSSGSQILDRQALLVVRGGTYPGLPSEAWAAETTHNFVVTVKFDAPE